MARIIFDEDKNKLVAEIYHTGYKDGVAAAKPSVKESCEDAISRDAVYNIVDDVRDCINVEGYCAILERLKKLPSVTSYETGYNDAKREIALSGEYERAYERGKSDAEQTRWIPVSERFPTKKEYIANNGLFIVSDGNRNYVEYFDIYDSKKFGELIVFGFRVDKCVIAWMPLPIKPYKAESEV